MGIVPATKILDPENARGFYVEVYLSGEKTSPLPLGGVQGLAALFSTLREISEFSKILRILTEIEPTTNIEISTVTFADDVSIFDFFSSND